MTLTILVQDKAPGTHSALRCQKHRPAERVGTRLKRGRKAWFFSEAGSVYTKSPCYITIYTGSEERNGDEK
jgi:hypothetical protein